MQFKKDEIKLALLREAEKEFLEKGFINSSLRKIVKCSGTSIGNFYNYFNNKEEIFEELVRDEYNRFMFLIKNHDNLRPDITNDIKDIGQLRLLLPLVMDQIMPSFTDSFILLVEGSLGTKYENSRTILIDILKEHVIEHMEEHNNKSSNHNFAEILAEQFLDGIILVLKKYKDKDIRKRLLEEHVLFYFLGLSLYLL